MERHELAEIVAEALQDAWNDHCIDTGCIPGEFTIRGPRTTRLRADFRGGFLAEHVANILAQDPHFGGRTVDTVWVDERGGQ